MEREKLGTVGRMGHCHFNRMFKEGLNEKIMFEQRLREAKEQSMQTLGE